MTVADALHERVVTITTDQTLEEAARTMLDRGVEHIGTPLLRRDSASDIS